VVGWCSSDDRGKCRVNRYCKVNASLLLAHIYETVTYVLTAQPNYPALIAHDVGHTKDRSTAVIGGTSVLSPGLCLIKQLEELPQGLYGSARAEALAGIDRRYYSQTLIFADLSFDPTYAEVLVERFGSERVIGLRISNSGDGMTAERMQVKNSAILRTQSVEAICSIYCSVNCITTRSGSLMDQPAVGLMGN
jgi:hypothetical protein